MSVTGTGTWYYSYDAGDRLTQIVNPRSETSQFFYDAANRQTGQTNGDGSTVATTFDSANRPTEIQHKNSSGTTLADYQYSYDGASNVSTWTDSDGTVVTSGVRRERSVDERGAGQLPRNGIHFHVHV